MFENYTEKARRALFFARYEAQQFGSPEIESEHMLLGLMREDRRIPDAFIPAERKNDYVTSIRKQIEDHIPRFSGPTAPEAFSTEVDRIIDFAGEEATRLGSKVVETEHLFLGILRERNSVAANLLEGLGIQLPDARQKLADGTAVIRPVTNNQRAQASAAQP